MAITLGLERSHHIEAGKKASRAAWGRQDPGVPPKNEVVTSIYKIETVMYHMFL